MASSSAGPAVQRWLRNCRVCPNFCAVDRLAGQKGRCRAGPGITVSSAMLHHGEEPVLTGRGGSGTIFLTSCSLRCLYCQNYDISQLDRGQPLSPEETAAAMLALQRQGAENINLVTPTHQAPQLMEALLQARGEGLRLPLVYNCGGYENPDLLRELEGLVDIYMPDFKYASDEAGKRYSGVEGYATWCRRALKEMHRQVGDLVMDGRGVARRGMLVRHLVLPGGIAGSLEVVDFITEELSRDTFLNVMDQYRPAYRAQEHRELRRRAWRSEVEEVIAHARRRGMRRIFF